VVLDGRNIGWGSTSASTALLQYEIDTHLVDLSERRGVENAVLAYRSCRDALNKIGELCEEVLAGDFARRPSLYFASRPEDLRPLRREFELRRQHGFEVEWLDADAIAASFDLKSEGAILSRGAEIDSYQLTHALLRDAAGRGARVYARTEVRAIDEKN